MTENSAVPEIGEQSEIIRTIDGAGALTQINQAEVSIMISTAKRYPRSIATFQRRVLDLATLDEETAAACFYSMPRGGKPIEGPSVRFAEIVASAWGNLHYGARDIGADEKWVHAQGVAWDLESNNRVFIEVGRRITDKYGRRYNDDMVGVTAQAAISIALRNVVFRVVPFALVKKAYDEARLTAIGKALSMEQRRVKAVEMFGKMGVGLDRILAALERKGIEDLTTEDLIELRGLFTAIKDGQVTIEEAFPAAAAKSDDAPKSLADLTKKAEGIAPAAESAQATTTQAGDETATAGLFDTGQTGAEGKPKK